jgi:hypothetical protein
MAIEEEFAIEIPDEEADAITSVGQGELGRVWFLSAFSRGVGLLSELEWGDVLARSWRIEDEGG